MRDTLVLGQTLHMVGCMLCAPFRITLCRSRSFSRPEKFHTKCKTIHTLGKTHVRLLRIKHTETLRAMAAGIALLLLLAVRQAAGSLVSIAPTHHKPYMRLSYATSSCYDYDNL